MHGEHLTVGTVVRDMLPNGSTDSEEKPTWGACPTWAPDLFAVSATLAKLSGCYAEPGIVLSRNDNERKHKRARAKIAAREGAKWSLDITVSPRTQRLWNSVIAAEDSLLCVRRSCTKRACASCNFSRGAIAGCGAPDGRASVADEVVFQIRHGVGRRSRFLDFNSNLSRNDQAV